MRAQFRSTGTRFLITHTKMTIEFLGNPKDQISKNFPNQLLVALVQYSRSKI